MGQIRDDVREFLCSARKGFYMVDEIFRAKKFSILEDLFLELTNLQRELSDLDNIKILYEKELDHRKRLEEAFQSEKTAFEDRLTSYRADLKKANEESKALKISLESELAKSMSEIYRTREELKQEIAERRHLEEELATTKDDLKRTTEELQQDARKWKGMVEKLQNSISQINVIANAVRTNGVD